MSFYGLCCSNFLRYWKNFLLQGKDVSRFLYLFFLLLRMKYGNLKYFILEHFSQTDEQHKESSRKFCLQPRLRLQEDFKSIIADQ